MNRSASPKPHPTPTPQPSKSIGVMQAPLYPPKPTHPHPQPHQISGVTNVNKLNPVRVQMLKGFMPQIINIAKSNGDPSLYAELILDNMNDDELEHFIIGENALENLAAINPGVMECKGWFEELRNNITTLLTEDSQTGTIEGDTQPVTTADDKI